MWNVLLHLASQGVEGFSAAQATENKIKRGNRSGLCMSSRIEPSVEMATLNENPEGWVKKKTKYH